MKHPIHFVSETVLGFYWRSSRARACLEGARQSMPGRLRRHATESSHICGFVQPLTCRFRVPARSRDSATVFLDSVSQKQSWTLGSRHPKMVRRRAKMLQGRATRVQRGSRKICIVCSAYASSRGFSFGLPVSSPATPRRCEAGAASRVLGSGDQSLPVFADLRQLSIWEFPKIRGP